MNAALLGDAKIAAAQSLNRAHTPSGKGYRFLGFAPHEQDYEPSADQVKHTTARLLISFLHPVHVTGVAGHPTD